MKPLCCPNCGQPVHRLDENGKPVLCRHCEAHRAACAEHEHDGDYDRSEDVT